jgi:hypothetical protein
MSFPFNLFRPFSRKSVGSWRFNACALSESSADAKGPRRGWFDLVGVDLSGALSDASLPASGLAAHDLVLLQVDIGAWRTSDIDSAGLTRLDDLLKSWSQAGRSLILRISYDIQGKTEGFEPDALAQIVSHASQVAPVISAYSSSILCYQGLLVGSWGEMNNSRYLSGRRLSAIYEALRAGLGPDIPVCLRTPRQVNLVRNASQTARFDEKLGVFDDAIMGSDTDLGSFSYAFDQDVSEARTSYFAEIGELALHAPFGGEAIGTNEFSDVEAAHACLSSARATYLNSGYDENTLKKWESLAAPTFKSSPVFPNMLEYVGAHLGYRLVVESCQVRFSQSAASAHAQSGLFGASASSDSDAADRSVADVYLSIENHGFAPLYEAAHVLVEAIDLAANKTISQGKAELDLTGRRRSCVLHIFLALSEDDAAGSAGGGARFALIARCLSDRDGRRIPFANAACTVFGYAPVEGDVCLGGVSC